MKKITIFRKILSKIYVLKHQNIFRYNDTEVKYLFDYSCGNKLAVIFSGFSENEKPAKYNYMSTLRKVRINKLFILDNIGYMKRGAYYLGKYPEFNFEKAVLELIKTIKIKYKITESFFCGSSKGGYASLYYGLKLDADAIVCGAPQYFVGDYLIKSHNEKILNYIISDNSERTIEKFNYLLREIIFNAKFRPQIYLHYSRNEHHYNEHVVHLIQDLTKLNHDLIIDEQIYCGHEEVGIYFSKYLKVKLQELAN
jgi:hypothetical protein